MRGTNLVVLAGNLAADPEVKETKEHALVANLRLACSERWQGKDGKWEERTEFVRVVAWRQLAQEAMGLEKGQGVYVQGRMRTRSYDKDGEKRYMTEVEAFDLQGMAKRDAPSGGARQASGGSGRQPAPARPADREPGDDGDGLPF